MSEPDLLRLVVRRVIPASRKRLFDAWTTPSQLESWWGPRGVRCVRAEVDLRVGGRYRIDNQLPDGRVVIITGEFLAVEPPAELIYTWRVGPGEVMDERITVQFIGHGAETEVVIIHERIGGERKREEHEVGWNGCLDGLAAFVGPATR